MTIESQKEIRDFISRVGVHVDLANQKLSPSLNILFLTTDDSIKKHFKSSEIATYETNKKAIEANKAPLLPKSLETKYRSNMKSSVEAE